MKKYRVVKRSPNSKYWIVQRRFLWLLWIDISVDSPCPIVWTSKELAEDAMKFYEIL